MKAEISKENEVCLLVQNEQDKEILTDLWKRLVLGTALLESGSQNVIALSVKLQFRDLHSDSQEIRR